MLETGQRQVALAELRESTVNPRTIEPERLEALKKAMSHDPEMLGARPLIALTTGEVIAGNMRLRAAKQLGWQTIETAVVDLDPERAREWMTRDNNPYGEYVEDQLARLVSDHISKGGDASLMGFEKEKVEDLLEALKEGDAIIPDADDPLEPELEHEVMIEVFTTHAAYLNGVGDIIAQLEGLDGVEVNITA